MQPDLDRVALANARIQFVHIVENRIYPNDIIADAHVAGNCSAILNYMNRLAQR